MYPAERSIYLVLLTAATVVLGMVVFFLLNSIRYQRKRRGLSQKELETALRFLEEDRARAAEELHDGLGSTLSAVKLRLQAIGPSSQQEVQLIEEAEASLDLVQYILRKVPARHFPQFVEQRGFKMPKNPSCSWNFSLAAQASLIKFSVYSKESRGYSSGVPPQTPPQWTIIIQPFSTATHWYPFNDGTINIAEFLAIVHALTWAKESEAPPHLFRQP